MSQFVRYWVLLQDGDPLPTIGSGFRTIEVIDRGSKVTVKGFTADQNVHLTAKEWNDIPHLLHNPSQTLRATLHLLRGYRPAKPCEACKK